MTYKAEDSVRFRRSLETERLGVEPSCWRTPGGGPHAEPMQRCCEGRFHLPTPFNRLDRSIHPWEAWLPTTITVCNIHLFLKIRNQNFEEAILGKPPSEAPPKRVCRPQNWRVVRQGSMSSNGSVQRSYIPGFPGRMAMGEHETLHSWCKIVLQMSQNF